MTRILLFLLALGLTTPAAQPLAAQPVATDCDRLAGYDHTPRLPGIGGVVRIADPAAAIAACARDADQPGADPFLLFLLARAYMAADPADPRIWDLVLRASDSYPVFGLSRQGFVLLEGAGGQPRDIDRARALHEEACAAAPDRFALIGCSNLANALVNDLGTPADLARALELFDMACRGGQLLACSNLGDKLSQGQSYPQDPPAALAAYQAGCALNDAYSCREAGWVAGNLLDPPAPAAQVAGDFQRACELGDGWACQALGRMQMSGEGIAADPVAGRANLELSCARNVAVGCYHLGRALIAGTPTQADLDRAAALFADLCAADNTEACTALDELNAARGR